MFDWIKRKITKKEWHYICRDGHTWISYNSPRSTFMFGTKATLCPECKTEICMGNLYKNGEYTGTGAVHYKFFTKKPKAIKKARKALNKLRSSYK